MSTKTITKRIALVAASALAIAGFSAVPANAATNAIVWCNIADGLANGDAISATGQAGNDACNGVAGLANSVELEFAAASVNSRFTITGPGTFGAAGDAADLAVATNGLSATVLAAGDQATTVAVSTPTVGTITVSYFELVAAGSTIYNTTATETVTITVNAAALAGGVKASTSTSIIDAGATWAGGATDDTVVVTAAASATPSSVIKVVLGQVAGAIATSTKVAVSITGPGSLILSDDDADPTATVIGTGRSLTSTVNATGETFTVGVAPDGNAGVGTITITAGAFTATEKVQFYGSLASLKASVKKNVRGDGAPTVGALDVIGYDKDGVVVPSVGLTITSGTTATIANFTETSSAAADVAAGTAVVDVQGETGKFGAVVLTIKDTATGLISTTATVNVGAEEAATVTASFDKTSYSGGDLAVLTITAKDGNGVAVGDTAAAFANAFTITTNGAVQGTIPTSAEFKLGVQTIKFYVPLVTSTLKASIDLATASAAWAAAIEGTTITAEASVEGDQASSLALDAANAATDAANNAYDEAQNATQAASDALAAVTALAAQVKSLIASVKKLTAAVAKLKK